MGASPIRPRKKQDEWKPHSTLQAVFELLTELMPYGISGSVEEGYFVLRSQSHEGVGKDICTSLVSLTQSIQNTTKR